MSGGDRGTWLRADGEGLLVDLRVTPKARVEALGGLVETGEGVRVQVKVRAPPDKGAANQAVEILLARLFHLSKGAVSVVSGHTSRLKTIRLDGDPEALAAQARNLVETT